MFARTPQYVLPMKNPTYTAADQDAYRSRFAELKATITHTFTGFEYDFVHVWAECTPQRRQEILEEIYQDGSLKLWLASFGEMFFVPEVSEAIFEFVRVTGRCRRHAARRVREDGRLQRPDAARPGGALHLRDPVPARPAAGRGGTHFWIDRTTGICASIYTNSLPFIVEHGAWEVYGDFERALYAAL